MSQSLIDHDLHTGHSGADQNERPLSLILLVVGVLALVGLRVYYGIRSGRGLGTSQEMGEFVVVAAGAIASAIALGTILSFKTKDLGKLANHQTPVVIGLLVSVVFSAFAVLKSFGLT